jgi:hypothetical protein
LITVTLAIRDGSEMVVKSRPPFILSIQPDDSLKSPDPLRPMVSRGDDAKDMLVHGDSFRRIRAGGDPSRPAAAPSRPSGNASTMLRPISPYARAAPRAWRRRKGSTGGTG